MMVKLVSICKGRDEQRASVGGESAKARRKEEKAIVSRIL